MTPSGKPKNQPRSTPSPAGETDDGSNGYVTLYGYASGESADVLRLYHGLGVTQFYEIPRQAVVSTNESTFSGNPSLSEVVLPSTTRIKYVSSRTLSLPASSVAAEVAAHNESSIFHVEDKCPVGCSYVGGRCICTTIDYWFHLSAEKAKALGVVEDT